MGSIVKDRVLPAWADEVRRRFLRGEAWQFVLHGNVYDVLLHEGKLVSVTDFLADVLLAPTKDTVVTYNLSTGVRFGKRKLDIAKYDDLILTKEPGRVLPALEKALTAEDRVAVIIEYAESVAPMADVSLSTTDDRSSVITLHRWSLLAGLEAADSIVLLVTENLAELHPKIVGNPRTATVRVPMPSTEERAAALRLIDKTLTDADVDRLAEITAGLKLIQLKAIFTAPPAGSDDAVERTRYITELLGGGGGVRERAEKLATITQGMTKDEIRKLIAPDGHPSAPAVASTPDRSEVDRLVLARKREIIERECFGMIEFVESKYGFEVVGGMEEVKKDLLAVARNIRDGRRSRVPMGILFTGPMGTGKTFVCEAFAKESGLTAIKLKNFRSKWVGATEGNLEKILAVIQAIGQILVIIDEGDRSFGSGSEGGESDGGTSSRVIARIKEFMSNTENRGRVLFVLMTNRPDKLDIDIKRAGRLDRKIPFFYPQTAADVAVILEAQFRKNKVATTAVIAEYAGAAAGMVGYSNADIEAIVLLAADYSNERTISSGPVTGPVADAAVAPDDLSRATHDYLPSRDVEMIEFMELLAVFEASNRRMLPAKYADLSIEELQARMQALKARVGFRR